MTKPKKRKPPHNIKQPELRELRPNERYVKTAGLTFILPNVVAPGDVLTEKLSQFLNTAYHTAIINRFTVFRKVLSENPNITYDEFDDELQAFFETASFSTRPTKQPTQPADSPVDAEEAALITFARPLFREMLRRVENNKITRKEYEVALRTWVNLNRPSLTKLLSQKRTLYAEMIGDGESFDLSTED